MNKIFSAANVTTSATLKAGSAIKNGACAAGTCTKTAGRSFMAGVRYAIAAHKQSNAPKALGTSVTKG